MVRITHGITPPQQLLATPSILPAQPSILRAYHLTMAALKILACLVAAACVHGQDSPAAPAAGTAPADSDAAPERPAEPITGNRLPPSRPE